jgi:2-dehydro-3-deoxyphosphogluconate aldolase/(4S)-4-hydroxy-2-oxoglutarate aldolase
VRAGLPFELGASGVIAVVRTRPIEFLPVLAGYLWDAGLGTIEIPISTPDACLAIRVLSETPATVGAGDVAEIAQVKAVIAAGAQFVSCPLAASGVIRCFAERGVAGIPLAGTPGDVGAAWHEGAAAVKVDHSVLVQRSWARRIMSALPDLPLIATGAIDDRIAGDCIRAGARAVTVGDWLVDDAAKGGDLGALNERAGRLVAAVATASLAK